MDRIMIWLLHQESQWFIRINRRKPNFLIDLTLSQITHLGGAALTILICLGLMIGTNAPWNRTAMLSLVALALSHIPVAFIKRKYPRKRPYLVLPDIRTGKNPLQDHSFPSGHTTAIFSVVVPFIFAMPMLGMILLPLALIVGFSRIHLGLHYPTDTIAGAILGCIAALMTVLIIG
jgi:undecaprenyl-diphosphatase